MRRNRRARKPVNRRAAPLRLTSLMDILTVLLLFLLKSFVVGGEVVTPVPGVDLPESSSETTPKSAIVIAIFGNNVMMDGELIITVSAAVDADDMYIEALAERLDAAREKIAEIARYRGDDEEFSGRVAIQGDRDINFEILQRVMYTCSITGFENISLAVIGTS